ncbi:MAG: hypothetical protein HY681_03860 [Chloroflexi bacterium]|nr:hypothetical protein [Chloroflexota bacterium]
MLLGVGSVMAGEVRESGLRVKFDADTGKARVEVRNETLQPVTLSDIMIFGEHKSEAILLSTPWTASCLGVVNPGQTRRCEGKAEIQASDDNVAEITMTRADGSVHTVSIPD